MTQLSELISNSRLDTMGPAVDRLFDDIASKVEKCGGVNVINRAARKCADETVLLDRMRNDHNPYIDDIKHLIDLRDGRRFVSLQTFAEHDSAGTPTSSFDRERAVTLEISWLQVFPCLMEQVTQAVEQRDLLAGRYILGKGMKEQELSGGLLATTAAMRVFGVSFVDMLDTNGAADRTNVHLGGPETLAGYFGGIGQPDDHPLTWIDEFLHYYKNYGVEQVLNINYGTVIAGYILHHLGVDIGFKLSVFLGNDNPYAVMMNLMLARLFARPDGSTPLMGLNFSNSITNPFIEQCSEIREAFGLTDRVRFEHHILQDQIGMVRQPFDRRAELADLARAVPNISAKHEGGDLAVEAQRREPSTVFDLFLSEAEIIEGGMLPRVTRSYLDKHDAINVTARTLLRQGIPVIAAPKLHGTL